MEFTVCNITVKLKFLFLWLVTILLCFNVGDEIKLGIFFSLLHEAGHLFAIIILKERPKEISFGLFGMAIKRQSDLSQNYKNEIITALSGPLTNYILSAVFIILGFFNSNSLILKSALINLVIASFNIMPVFSLDGGRALEAFLKLRFENDKSEKLLKLVSFLSLFVMLFAGIYILILSGYNFTLLAISVYLIILLFIKC